MQGRFEEYRRFCEEYSCRHIEVSNGTIEMPNAEKAGYIRKLAGDFTIVSEVGFKDPGRSEMLPPSEWVASIKEDIDAGASLVTLEARESGSSGICRPDGELRYGLIEDVLSAGIGIDTLLFEAPTTALQTHMITRIGPNVNLGNVPAQGVIGLETLRLGLRSDTLTAVRVIRPVRQTVRTTSDVFHLAIPTHDLDAAQEFYVTKLGCKLARRYDDRITLDFFGDQVVCHLTAGRARRAGEPVPTALRRHVPRGCRLRGAVRLRGHQEDPVLLRCVTAV